MRTSSAWALVSLTLVVGCDPKTFGGQEIGRIEYEVPGEREQITLELPKNAKIAFYEDYSLRFGGGSGVYAAEECFRLHIGIEQKGTKNKLECYPFGGTKSKYVKSIKCFSSHTGGGKEDKTVCRINDCSAKLKEGGKTTISAQLEAIKSCPARVKSHTVIIKKADDD